MGSPIFRANIINILIDYSTKMDKILDKMIILMAGLELVAILQPTPLDRVLDLTLDTEMLTFLDLLIAEALQMLSTPTKFASNNPETSRLDTTIVPTSNAHSKSHVVVGNLPMAAGETPTPILASKQPHVIPLNHSSLTEL